MPRAALRSQHSVDAPMRHLTRRSCCRLVAYGLPCIAVASQARSAAQPPRVAAGIMRPAVDFDASWPIAESPDLGQYNGDAQQVVDFAVWQARDRSYQLWSCIRHTKAPGETRLFHGWEGRTFDERNWSPLGIVQMSSRDAGEREGHIQAPYVVAHDSLFWMFYSSGGHIYLQTSADGKRFSRRPLSNTQSWLFGAGYDVRDRDPMIIRANDRWYIYYTGAPDQKGAVYARTSSDLVRWSEPTLVAAGGSSGTGRLSAECPHVVARKGAYYLFRTQQYGADAQTMVYRSSDPLIFGINEDDEYLVTRLPIAAPEILQVGGREYIAYLESSLKGIRVAPLNWLG
jgi:hypothetical protein